MTKPVKFLTLARIEGYIQRAWSVVREARWDSEIDPDQQAEAQGQLSAIDFHIDVLGRHGWTMSDVVAMRERIRGEWTNPHPLYQELKRICAKVERCIEDDRRAALREERSKRLDRELILRLTMDSVEGRLGLQERIKAKRAHSTPRKQWELTLATYGTLAQYVPVREARDLVSRVH